MGRILLLPNGAADTAGIEFSFGEEILVWLGSFRARFQSFGQQPEMTIFQFGIPLQILHFWAWQLSGKISKFGPAA